MAATPSEPSPPSPPSPEDVLRSPTLSRAQKIEKLRQMSYDARELQVATEEGMGGNRGPDLDRIQRALRELGADDHHTDAKQ